MIDHKEVPIIQIGTRNQARRVTTIDHFMHFIISVQSESIIDVYVERKENDDFSGACEYLVEPTKHFQEEYPLQMATTLVYINKGCTWKVRLLNPFPAAMTIKQESVVGQAEQIDGSQWS